MNLERFANKIRKAIDLDMTVVIVLEGEAYRLQATVTAPSGFELSVGHLYDMDMLDALSDPEAHEDWEAACLADSVWTLINGEALPTPPPLEASFDTDLYD